MKIFFFGIKVILYIWKKYKYSVYQFFGYENGFWYKGARTQKLIWKIPLKGYCMILKKTCKILFFSNFWWKSVVGMISWATSRVKVAKCIKGYYTILWHKYKNWFFSFMKMVFLVLFMQPSKTTLNLPSSSLHLCSPLKEIRRVKIHHQFTSFPK